MATRLYLDSDVKNNVSSTEYVSAPGAFASKPQNESTSWTAGYVPSATYSDGGTWTVGGLSTTVQEFTGTRSITSSTGPKTAPGLILQSGTGNGTVYVPYMSSSAPVASQVTISGTVTLVMGGSESSMSANAAIGYTCWAYHPDGTVDLIFSKNYGTELPTSMTEVSTTVTPTQTVLNPGDRIVSAIYFDDATSTTMGSGYTLTAQVTNSTSYSNAYIEFAETISFISGTWNNTVNDYATSAITLNFLDDSSDVSVSGVTCKKVWTDSVSASASYLTDTLTTSNVFGDTMTLTAGSGGNQLAWFTPPLGAVDLNTWGYAILYATVNTAGNYTRILIDVYKTDSDGSNPVRIGLIGPSGNRNYPDTRERWLEGWISGSISTGQRIKYVMRCFDDDPANTQTGGTFTLILENSTYPSHIKLGQSISAITTVAVPPVVVNVLVDQQLGALPPPAVVEVALFGTPTESVTISPATINGSVKISTGGVADGIYSRSMNNEVYNNPRYFAWRSLDTDGDYMVVGDYGFTKSPDTSTNDYGFVQVWKRNGDSWEWQQDIEPPSALKTNSRYFGYDVAISGDTIAVGAPASTGVYGSVCVYTRSGTTWSHQQTIDMTGDLTGEGFGRHVDIYGDTIVASWRDSYVYLESSWVGGIVVFTRSAGTWTQQWSQSCPSGYTGTNPRFGEGVAIENGTIVTQAEYWTESGDTFWGGYRGAIFVFTGSGSSWTQQQVIKGDGTNNAVNINNSWWGLLNNTRATLKGDLLLVPRIRNNGSGVVIDILPYTRSGSTWSNSQTISFPESDDTWSLNTGTGSDGLAIIPVIHNSTTISIGAPQWGDGTWEWEGKVYWWKYSGGSWSLVETMKHPNNNGTSGSFGQGRFGSYAFPDPNNASRYFIFADSCPDTTNYEAAYHPAGVIWLVEPNAFGLHMDSAASPATIAGSVVMEAPQVGAGSSGTATVSGVGSTSASATQIILGTSSATGVGSTSALVTQSVVAPAVDGVGSTSASAQQVQYGTSSASGVGSTTATAIQTIRSTSSATGSGSSSAIATQVAVASSTGVGSTSASAIQTLRSTSSATGAGSTSATGTLTIYGTSSVTGAGSTTSAGSQIQYGSSSATGAGSTSALSTLSSVSSSTGSGSTSAITTIATTSSVDGVGSVTAVGEITAVNGEASVAGVGSTSAIATQISYGTSSASGVGSVNTPLVTLLSPSSQTGVGSTSADATQISYGVASSTGAGTTSATGIQTLRSTSTVVGTGSTSALVTQQAVGSATGSGSTSAAAIQTLRSTSSVVGVGSTSALATQVAVSSASGTGSTSSTVVQIATASVAGEGTVGASSTQDAYGEASVTGVGSVAADAIQTIRATSSIVGVGSSSALATQQAVASSTGAGSTSATAYQILYGSSSVVGTGTTSALVTQQAVVAVSGVGTTTATVTQAPYATVAGVGSTTATATQTSYGSSSVDGVGTTSATGSLTIYGTSSVDGAGSVSSAGYEVAIYENDGTSATDVSGTWDDTLEQYAWDNIIDTYVVTNSSVTTHVIDITGYDFASVVGPEDELVDVSINVSQYVSDAAKFNAPTIQAYNGATPIGSPIVLTERTIEGNEDETLTVTISDIRSPDFKIRYSVEQVSV